MNQQELANCASEAISEILTEAVAHKLFCDNCTSGAEKPCATLNRLTELCAYWIYLEGLDEEVCE